KSVFKTNRRSAALVFFQGRKQCRFPFPLLREALPAMNWMRNCSQRCGAQAPKRKKKQRSAKSNKDRFLRLRPMAQRFQRAQSSTPTDAGRHSRSTKMERAKTNGLD